MRLRWFCVLVVALVLIPTVLTSTAQQLVTAVLHAATQMLGGGGG